MKTIFVVDEPTFQSSTSFCVAQGQYELYEFRQDSYMCRFCRMCRMGPGDKEVCNRGVACSLLKLGSLGKTIIASLFHSGLHSGTIFLWKKQCHMSY